jgi:hypothetical protein
LVVVVRALLPQGFLEKLYRQLYRAVHYPGWPKMVLNTTTTKQTVPPVLGCVRMHHTAQVVMT